MSNWSGARSRAARKAILYLVEQGAPCSKCGQPVRLDQHWHADHLVPRVYGGSDEIGNLWPAHAKCNMADGGRIGSRHRATRRDPVRNPNDDPVEARKIEQERGIRGI